MGLKQSYWHQVWTLCIAAAWVALAGAHLLFAQWGAPSAPSAPPVPPAPPSATIPNPGQPQFSPTPMILMNPPGGSMPGLPTGGPTMGRMAGQMAGFPGASIVIVPTVTQPTPSSPQNQNQNQGTLPIVIPYFAPSQPQTTKAPGAGDPAGAIR